MDCWTSKNQLPFQGVIANWIDSNYDARSVVIDLSILQGSHTGKRLAESFIEVLDDFEITRKINAVTSDNAGNMDTFFKKLEDTLQSRVSYYNLAVS